MNQDTNKTLDNVNSSLGYIAPTPTPTESVNDESAQKYLVITEWDIKLPLSEKYKDLRYTTIQKSDNEEYATLEKVSIADKYANPDGINGFNNSCSGHLGKLIRFNNPDALTNRGYISGNLC